MARPGSVGGPSRPGPAAAGMSEPGLQTTGVKWRTPARDVYGGSSRAGVDTTHREATAPLLAPWGGRGKWPLYDPPEPGACPGHGQKRFENALSQCI